MKNELPDYQMFFDSETLSHEWPVVIACFSTKSSSNVGEPMTYVAFSRAEFKLIVIKAETDPEDSNMDDYETIFSIMESRPSTNNCPRPPAIEMLGLHQILHQREYFTVMRHLKIHVFEIIKKLNYWIGLLALQVDEKLFWVIELQNVLIFYKLIFYC